MGELVFIVLILICLGIIYLTHRYSNKNYFYLLSIIFAITSFVMSFRLTRVFGLDINMGIIFSGGLIGIVYYFINKFDKKELRGLLVTILASTLGIELFLGFNSLLLPSVFDVTIYEYQNLVFNNIAMFILYPISTLIIFILSSYCFAELKLDKNKKLYKTLITIVGIVFIDVFVFLYFSYAFIIGFEEAIYIALSNYFIKMLWTVITILCIDKIIKVKKVKE